MPNKFGKLMHLVGSYYNDTCTCFEVLLKVAYKDQYR